MIKGSDLAMAGYEWYPRINGGDEFFCHAFYQKFVGKQEIQLTFWRWNSKEQPQINLTINNVGYGLQEKVEIIGVPAHWTVEDVENYADRINKFFYNDSIRFEYARRNAMSDSFKETMRRIEDGSERTYSWREVEDRILGKYASNDEDSESISY